MIEKWNIIKKSGLLTRESTARGSVLRLVRASQAEH